MIFFRTLVLCNKRMTLLAESLSTGMHFVIVYMSLIYERGSRLWVVRILFHAAHNFRSRG